MNTNDEWKRTKTFKKLGNYFEYAEKPISIHEAAHVVAAYLVGHSCLSMQTGIHRNVDLKNINLEIDTQSISKCNWSSNWNDNNRRNNSLQIRPRIRSNCLENLIL